MYNFENFEVLTDATLSDVNGGKGFGWVGLVQPLYDFGSGVVKGFADSIRKHG